MSQRNYIARVPPICEGASQQPSKASKANKASKAGRQAGKQAIYESITFEQTIYAKLHPVPNSLDPQNLDIERSNLQGGPQRSALENSLRD